MELQPPKLPELYPEQFEALYDPRRWVVIEASTKAGKTIGCAVWLINQGWNGQSGASYAWMSYTIERCLDPGLKSVKSLLESWDPDRRHWTHHIAKRELELHPGGRPHCVFHFFGAEEPDSIYGPEYAAAVVDEASRCKEESWHALRSTLTTYGGPARFIGNVKGRNNWMYKMGVRGRSCDPADSVVGYHKITALTSAKYGRDKPGGFLPITDQEIEDARRTLPPVVFRELYLAEPSDLANSFFNGEAVNRMRSVCYEPTRYSYDAALRSMVFEPRGPWRVWRRCPGLPDYLRRLAPSGATDVDYKRSVESGQFVMGVDLGYGNGQSNSVIAVFDVLNREVVAEYADPNTMPYGVAKEAAAVGLNVFNEPEVCWECNGPGEGWHRALASEGYTRMYRQRREGTKGERSTRAWGWRSTRSRKKDRLMSLNAWMSTGRFTAHSDPFLDEAERYVMYENDEVGPDTQADVNTGARAAHGDRVIAYMLAQFVGKDTPRAVDRLRRAVRPGTAGYGLPGLMDDGYDDSVMEPVFSSDINESHS